MQKPVKYFKITQPFKSGIHYGIDLGWSEKNGGKNQPLYAIEDGKVISVQVQKTGGNVLHIRHNNGLVSEYGHCDKIIVKKGDDVVKGQHVANMGRTGIVTGNHCHLGLYKGSSINYSKMSGFVNPVPYLTEDYKEPSKNNYSKGNYKTLEAMRVRTGPGTNHAQKKLANLLQMVKRMQLALI